MSDKTGPPPNPSPSVATPGTTALLLTTFSDFYRQELGAEEDVHRSLPFFGTALGLVIGALAYAAGRLPKWTMLSEQRSVAAFVVSATLLTLAVVEATCVLIRLSQAITRHGYLRIGSETAMMLQLGRLQAHYDSGNLEAGDRDSALATDIRQMLLESYLAVTPQNRDLNQRRYRLRAIAARHLVRSLIWALLATTVILLADKVGYLPRAVP